MWQQSGVGREISVQSGPERASSAARMGALVSVMSAHTGLCRERWLTGSCSHCFGDGEGGYLRRKSTCSCCGGCALRPMLRETVAEPDRCLGFLSVAVLIS